MAPSLTPDDRSAGALRQDIERWFRRRGVPQLIEGYSSEPAMDARAAPLIAGWLVLGTIWHWGTRPDWPVGWNILGVAATLAWMAVVWTIASRLRGRRVLGRPGRLDLIDIATLGFLPVVPAALIDWSAREAITAALGALAGIGVVYVIVGFGLIEIGLWAVERLWIEVTQVVRLVARTLPILLILVVFLLFGSEIWQMAHAMSPQELLVLLSVLFAAAALLVVSTVQRDLARLAQRMERSDVVRDARGTPAEPPIEFGGEPPRPIPRLTAVQRGNLTLLVAVPHLVQAVAVAGVIMAVLVLLAIVAIPASLQADWIGEPARAITSFEAHGEVRTVSAELLTVSAILAGIVGLYFSGLAISDESYRREQYDLEVGGSGRCLPYGRSTSKRSEQMSDARRAVFPRTPTMWLSRCEEDLS